MFVPDYKEFIDESENLLGYLDLVAVTKQNAGKSDGVYLTDKKIFRFTDHGKGGFTYMGIPLRHITKIELGKEPIDVNKLVWGIILLGLGVFGIVLFFMNIDSYFYSSMFAWGFLLAIIGLVLFIKSLMTPGVLIIYASTDKIVVPISKRLGFDDFAKFVKMIHSVIL